MGAVVLQIIWVTCGAQPPQTAWSIGFHIKRKRPSKKKKPSWLHKHKPNTLVAMFTTSTSSSGRQPKAEKNVGQHEGTKRRSIRCTAAKQPAAEEPQDNSKRPIPLHQEHFSVLKIKNDSYKNGNKGIRMSVKGKLERMGVE